MGKRLPQKLGKPHQLRTHGNSLNIRCGVFFRGGPITVVVRAVDVEPLMLSG